ncbi:4'-phosphopantetheinyl transferase family protein [Streptomyces cyaneofuscatus]|uniref:4'-phosphopantetheinyl transferase family protein n=1 Tax=Streptomyces cyaneofuscatus TaxID=66883 RepID=UPI00343F67FF
MSLNAADLLPADGRVPQRFLRQASPAAPRITIGVGDVHVWWFRPQDQSARSRSPGGGGRSPAGRKPLEILGAYLGRSLAEQDIDRTCEHCGHPHHGRPRLRGDELSFNISHIEGRVVMAVARTPVGIGLEPISAGRLVLESASTIFTDEELSHFPGRAALDVHTAAWAWCAKEAMVKATGYGLVVDPRDVLAPLQVPANTWHPARFIDGRRLWLTPAGLPGHCVCAVAVSGESPQLLTVRAWPPPERA